MIKNKFYLITVFFLYSFNIFSITCTKDDFIAEFCNLPIMPGTRCANVKSFSSFCNNKTDGCEKISGGCFGFTPPGHWYSLLDEKNTPKWRCRCGCFAEESLFYGLENQTGLDLIEKGSSQFKISSLNNIEKTTFSHREITGFMHSKERNGIFIQTQSNKKIILSEAHPVILEKFQMKQAKDLVLGDKLLDKNSKYDLLIKKKILPYGREMVNFHVASDQPAHHIVIASGLQMGDLGWQEHLNSIGSRIYYRQEILNYLKKNP
jgi:hypothetical protein